MENKEMTHLEKYIWAMQKLSEGRKLCCEDGDNLYHNYNVGNLSYQSKIVYFYLNKTDRIFAKIEDGSIVAYDLQLTDFLSRSFKIYRDKPIRKVSLEMLEELFGEPIEIVSKKKIKE